MAALRPDILLITVDSLRADHLGCYGYARPTTPNIDRLAEQGTLLTSAFANGPNTPHAFPAIMASRYPLMSNRLGLFEAPQSLAEMLKTAGYRTAAFNAGNPWVSRYFRYDRGFDHFDDFIDFASIAGNAPTGQAQMQEHSLFRKSLDGMARIARSLIPRDSSVYDFLEHWKVFLKGYASIHHSLENKRQLLEEYYSKVEKWIRGELQSPFFLWLHLMDTHYPYIPDARFLDDLGLERASLTEAKKLAVHVKYNLSMNAAALQKTQALYDAAIREMDARLGAIFRLFEKQGRFENMFVVFTADHGEEFLDHNGFKHTSKLYDELIHVPFILRRPQGPAGRVDDRLISHLDLIPTLSRMLELDGGPHAFLGTPYQDALGDQIAAPNNFVISESAYDENGEMPTDDRVFALQAVPKVYSLRTAKWKLIQDSLRGPTHLFHVQEDPKEEENLIKRRGDVANRLSEILQIHIKKEYASLMQNHASRLQTQQLA